MLNAHQKLIWDRFRCDQVNRDVAEHIRTKESPFSGRPIKSTLSGADSNPYVTESSVTRQRIVTKQSVTKQRVTEH